MKGITTSQLRQVLQRVVDNKNESKLRHDTAVLFMRMLDEIDVICNETSGPINPKPDFRTMGYELAARDLKALRTARLRDCIGECVEMMFPEYMT